MRVFIELVIALDIRIDKSSDGQYATKCVAVTVLARSRAALAEIGVRGFHCAAPGNRNGVHPGDAAARAVDADRGHKHSTGVTFDTCFLGAVDGALPVPEVVGGFLRGA